MTGPAGSEEPAAVWFAYSPDRKGEHPAGHLEKYAGVLQADGYAGFNQLYEKGRIVEAACWAHVRRKFHDLYQAHRSPIAKEALERIGQLYGIEQEIRVLFGTLPRCVKWAVNCRVALFVRVPEWIGKPHWLVSRNSIDNLR